MFPLTRIKLYSTLSLSTQGYKWESATLFSLDRKAGSRGGGRGEINQVDWTYHMTLSRTTF